MTDEKKLRGQSICSFLQPPVTPPLQLAFWRPTEPLVSSIHTTSNAVHSRRICGNPAGCSLLKNQIYFFPVARIFHAIVWVTNSKILARNAKLENSPITFPVSLSAHPSVCPHVTTWHPLGGFSLSLILGSFSDIQTLVKNGQKLAMLLINTYKRTSEQLRR